MGAVDTRAPGPQRRPDELLGAKVVPVELGQRDPQGRDQRGAARLGRQRRPHGLPLRHRRRPAPVPEHGARLHPRHRRRGAGPVPRALRRAARRDRRVRRRRLQRDRPLHRVPRRRRRRDLRLRGRRRRRRDRPPRGHHPRRRPSACCTARAPTCCRTRTARPSSPTRSPPASTTRASGPQHAHLAATGRATYLPVTDAEAMDAMALLTRTEGIIPAIESAHAIAGGLRVAERLAAEKGPEATVLINLSGRGDKDMGTAVDVVRPRRPRRRDRGPGRMSATTGTGSGVAPAFARARAEDRAALVGYLPAGLPRRRRRHRRRCAPWSTPAVTSSRSGCPTATR